MSNEFAFPRSNVPPVVPLLNPVVRRLLGAGLPVGPNVLLTVRGRTSGLARTFPVAMLELDGRRYVQSTFGEANWVRNLRASPAATLRLRGVSQEIEAVELTPEEAAATLRQALAPYGRSWIGKRLVGLFFHIRPDAPLDDFVAEARRHPTFELRPKA